MDPRKLPFNALIVGPTNSGKTQYLLNQLRGPFKGKFDYIVLLCPTFVKNKTYEGFVDRDPHIFVIVCLQHEIEDWLRVASFFSLAPTPCSYSTTAPRRKMSRAARGSWSILASAPGTMESPCGS